MESEACTQTSTPSASPAPVDQSKSFNNTQMLGTVIPNRIFVGGIDNRITRNDLRRCFSRYGTIKEVNVVFDRAGMSKGYGFVTFENQEDAQRVLHTPDHLTYRDKRLNISQAIRKQHVGEHTGGFAVENPSLSVTAPNGLGTMCLTTSTGCPYTYHNGVAYFQMPDLNTLAPYWSAAPTLSGSSYMVTQPTSSFYAPQTFQQYQYSSQCVSGHLPYTTFQAEVPVSSYTNPILYIQPSELMYHPVEMPADPGYVQSALPLVETVREEFKFHPARRGFPQSSIHLKPRYGRGGHYTHLREEHRPNAVRSYSQPASSLQQEMQQ